MANEINELLQQILNTQQEHLAAFEDECQRAAEFRLVAMEAQNIALRRQRSIVIAGLIVLASCAIILLLLLAKLLKL